MVIKINNGNITIINVIIINKVGSKSSINSTNGRAEIKISKCKTVPSKSLSKGFAYGFKIRWIKAVITQKVRSKNCKTKLLEKSAMIMMIIISRQIM